MWLDVGLIRSLQQMGRDDYVKHMGGGYEEAVQWGKYKVEISYAGNDTRLVIWTPDDKPCITGLIANEDKVAVIATANYSPSCTIDGNMKRGEGTREMFKDILKMLKVKGAVSVQLADKSSVMCEGKEIELGPFYFLKHGQTWYEKYFGFKPSEKYRVKYEKVKENRLKLLEIERLKEAPCTDFTEEMVRELFRHITFDFFDRIVWERSLSTLLSEGSLYPRQGVL
jgi:hypothetical protein